KKKMEIFPSDESGESGSRHLSETLVGFQELGFLPGVLAPQHRVAMRKAAKAGDDIAMLACEMQGMGVAKGLVEFHGTLLIGKFLAMHEGQVEKLPGGLVQFLVEAAIQRGAGMGQREIVAFEG